MPRCCGTGPAPRCRAPNWCVSPEPLAPYSGMVPGWLAGALPLRRHRRRLSGDCAAAAGARYLRRNSRRSTAARRLSWPTAARSAYEPAVAEPGVHPEPPSGAPACWPAPAGPAARRLAGGAAALAADRATRLQRHRRRRRRGRRGIAVGRTGPPARVTAGPRRPRPPGHPRARRTAAGLARAAPRGATRAGACRRHSALGRPWGDPTASTPNCCSGYRRRSPRLAARPARRGGLAVCERGLSAWTPCCARCPSRGVGRGRLRRRGHAAAQVWRSMVRAHGPGAGAQPARRARPGHSPTYLPQHAPRHCLPPPTAAPSPPRGPAWAPGDAGCGGGRTTSTGVSYGSSSRVESSGAVQQSPARRATWWPRTRGVGWLPSAQSSMRRKSRQTGRPARRRSPARPGGSRRDHVQRGCTRQVTPTPTCTERGQRPLQGLPVVARGGPTWLVGRAVEAIVDEQAELVVRISAIVDACFRLIVDGVSAPSWTRGGCAQARCSMYLNRPRSV